MTPAAGRPAVMLLAAGLGTRLAPLTNELPKPLVWLGDRPLADGILAQLAASGFDRAVLNTHHLADRYDAAWVGRQPLEIQLVHEPRILGTAGGVANAASALGPGPVLVWNADIFAEPDLAILLQAHETGAEAVARLVTGPRLEPNRGTLGLDGAGCVVRVRKFDAGQEVSSADYAGIALLTAELRAVLPPEGCLVGDVLVPALGRGASVTTTELARPFHDLGTPEAYVTANVAWLAARGLRAFVHETATVAPDVMLSRTVVAREAEVAGEGALEEVVVWPGAKARAPLRRAVVTPSRVVSLR